MATYKVTLFRAEGHPREKVVTFSSAPSESGMAAWCRKYQPFQWDLAIRYYPSRKGWLVLDMRHTFRRVLGNGNQVWSGVRRGKRVYPSEDAAAMAAVFMLNPPVQESLAL